MFRYAAGDQPVPSHGWKKERWRERERKGMGERERVNGRAREGGRAGWVRDFLYFCY